MTNLMNALNCKFRSLSDCEKKTTVLCNFWLFGDYLGVGGKGDYPCNLTAPTRSQHLVAQEIS